MRSIIRYGFALVLAFPVSLSRADDPAPLPGTKPLTLEGDIASQLVEGVDKFLLRKTEESIAKRARFWKRDTSSPEKYVASIEPNRARFAKMIGVVDKRVPFDELEFVEGTKRSPLVGRGKGFEVFTVRWPAFGDVHGEGLLLLPADRRFVADVVAIPDADQTPEQVVGLVKGVAPEYQFARRLAESGCRVVVPVLIDRKAEPRNGRAKLTSREYIYRSAFELGRHIIGYEVQKVLAAVDWFVSEAEEKDPKICVFGYGEGGLLALYASAIDTRIDAVGVSGYFGPREGLWKETLDHNVFGLLEEFGDADIASLISPRFQTMEFTDGPTFVVPPETGGGPGRFMNVVPEDDSEIRSFRKLTEGLSKNPKEIQTIVATNSRGPGIAGLDATLGYLLSHFTEPIPLMAGQTGPLSPLGPLPKRLDALPDPVARQARQLHELDRHNQELLADSPNVRKAYFKKLDTTSLDTFNKTIEPYREAFRDDVIGRFDDPFLPPDARSRQIYDEPTFTGYEVVMDVFPDVIAYGILLVPKGMKEGEKRPVVVCQHGLGGRPQDVANPKLDVPAYHAFAAKLAERGFVTFAPQNLYLFGDRFRTLQRKANPLKKTLFSIIVPQHQQITDWLKGLPFVDPARIGFYGLSYGGKSAMRIPPLVSNYCLSICSADFNEWVGKNASTHSDYSYVWSPEYEIFEWDLGSTFNYAEMASLIAPRPFMVERGHFDGVGSDEAVAYEFAKVRFLYEAKLGIGDRCELEYFVGPHTIHGVGTFDFLHKHLNWPKPK